MQDIFQSQIAIAGTVVWFIERLKLSERIPGWAADSDKLNRWTAALFAAASAIGFTWGFTGSLAAGGTLTIHVPAFDELIRFVVNIIFSMISQEAIYRSAVKKVRV